MEEDEEIISFVWFSVQCHSIVDNKAHFHKINKVTVTVLNIKSECTFRDCQSQTVLAFASSSRRHVN